MTTEYEKEGFMYLIGVPTLGSYKLWAYLKQNVHGVNPSSSAILTLLVIHFRFFPARRSQ